MTKYIPYATICRYIFNTGYLQRKHHDYSNDADVSGESVKNSRKGKLVHSYYCVTNKIQTEIEQLIEKNDMSDAQLLDRIYTLCNIEAHQKKSLFYNLENNPDKCIVSAIPALPLTHCSVRDIAPMSFFNSHTF